MAKHDFLAVDEYFSKEVMFISRIKPYVVDDHG